MLRGYLDQLRALAQDPTSNLVASAMGVSIAVIFLVIVVLILLFFALSPGTARIRGSAGKKRSPQRATRKPKPASPEEIQRRRIQRRRAMQVWWSTIAGGMAIAWIALFAGTSASGFCSNTCHAMVGPGDSWKQSAHKAVPCVRCHEGTPAASLLTGTVTRVRSMYYSLADVPADGMPLPSRRCLSCHERIMSTTIVTKRMIAMSHAEPLNAGAVCSDCHGMQGHQQEILDVGMQACIRCHDGKQAPTDCSLCHPKGIEAGLRLNSQTIGNPVRLPSKPKCGGCHSQDKCDACHGLRMPHPDDFETPQQHARLAAFTGKERICYRCHSPAECMECHQDFVAHGLDWAKKHQAQKRADGDAYCLWCHTTPQFCTVCH